MALRTFGGALIIAVVIAALPAFAQDNPATITGFLLGQLRPLAGGLPIQEASARATMPILQLDSFPLVFRKVVPPRQSGRLPRNANN